MNPEIPRALAVLNGQALSPPPVWLMRQAGRYLPEYRELRAEKGSFLKLCYDSEAAAEITLQPIRRFGFDVAILFSDILIVPHAIGQDLSFAEGEGPRLAPPLKEADLASLAPARHHYDAIWETVRKVRSRLAPDKALFGFAGSPYTVATYMVAGQGSKDQADARLMAYADPARFQALISRIEAETLHYLSGQIEAGADALMLFDSWSGSLAPTEFERWVIAPTARLVDQLRARHPQTPIIGFPRGAAEKAPAYARETRVSALAIDESTDLHFILANTPDTLPLQGNLDPMALKAGGEPLSRAMAGCLEAMAGRPHILNLGHGIDRFTPIAHVEQLLAELRG
ncbi:uroporphyrinogen decarboxylase [Sandaracinobacter neustonicus]|uniref:Uroporphyrinogen decarboxylase n=1 Tax=Sandaracinobacter neustonicus TaxID=1715348 RepID=A0A501XSW0_9SPHN|nr:uroporphyrinogen decarboxylase [Sandaracinobacter neustonicus]TPE63294.1 uroporphyrinogen decarboxylase [Sandaracinobacter neustonicus]